MDMKQQLDKMFEEREARQRAKKDEADTKASAESARRNAWLTFINTTLEPALKDFARTLTAKGVEVETGIDNVSPVVGGWVSMLVASTDRSVKWQASSLRIACLDTIKFTGEVWGRKSKTPFSHAPVKGSIEYANREMVESQLLAFAEKVIRAAE
ncbi:hypothetical protein CDR19_25600 [Ectopseudomonas toyotomiensis]|uniref:Uncharacterized protein n=1 Tax=Ectopseudomonas toyotomiensis TaxID=554344 RepID=A0A1I5Z624_9GAMM|nr:hypothetical protein [Pseudomonas toyotomiensis]PIA65989.1 hypothetical protein CDR19_25600 [Pseudomonas toyotomiensis]SFQ51567.1 hypothetical protein SAMN05216177_1266 [Pseudomonas toyotomiensis]